MRLSWDKDSALVFWLQRGTVPATSNAEDSGSLQPTTMSPRLRSIHTGVCISPPFIVERLQSHASSSRRFRISASVDVRSKTRSNSSCSSNRVKTVRPLARDRGDDDRVGGGQTVEPA